MPAGAPRAHDPGDRRKERAMKPELLPAPRATLAGGTVADAMHPGVVTCSYATPLATVARMPAVHRIDVGGDEDDRLVCRRAGGSPTSTSSRPRSTAIRRGAPRG